MKSRTLFFAALAGVSPFCVSAESLTVGNETITYSSGDHTYDSVTMNSGAKNKTSRLVVSGGSLAVTGTTTMNGSAEGQVADLVICGNATGDIGTIDQNNSWVYGAAKSYFTISNNAEVSFGNYKGLATSSAWAYLTVADNARLVQKADTALTMPTASSATAPCFTMTVRDNASAELTAVTLNNSHGAIRTEGHGQLVVRGNVNTYDTKVDMICAADDSTIVVRGDTEILSGGGILVQDRAKFIQAGGYLDLGWMSSPNCYLTVSNQAAVVSTNKINVGRASATDTPHVFVRLCDGGTLEFPGFQYGRMAYWANDTWKRSMTNLYCEGGVMRPMAENADFIRYWKYAQLVGAGLTLDTAGYATGVEQVFEGTTFTKTGLGMMTVRSNSVHTTTAVAKGTMLLADGVNYFGANLVVTNGANVSTEGDSTGLQLQSLTLGNATSAGQLTLDGSDTIEVATAANLHIVNGQIYHGFVEFDGEYDLIIADSGTVTADQIAGLHIANAVVGKKYNFKIASTGSGSKVTLEVKSSVIVENTWTGATDSAWRTTSNWSLGKYPDDVARAIFPSSAANKEVSIVNAEEAYRMEIHDSYAFSGAGSLVAGAFAVDAGASTFGVAVPVSGDLSVAVSNTASLTLSGALTGADAASVSKSGTGTLTVSGANAGYSGGWNVSAGTLVFQGETAAGTSDPTTALSSFTGGTVSFFGSGQVLQGTVETDPGATTAMVFCADGATTIANGIASLSGGFVQRGSGRLTLRYGVGQEFKLAKDLLGGSPTGAVSFPTDGSSPASTALAAMNVLSGTLRIEGQGVNNTRLNEYNLGVFVGGNWAAAPASARLELSKVNLYTEGSRSFVVGNCVSSLSATRPTLSVESDGRVWTTYGTIGRENASFAGAVYPTLAITNGTFASYLDTAFGCNSATSKVHPVLRIGAGGWLYAPRANLNRAFTYCLGIGHGFDGEVADGGYIETGCWGFCLTAAASGEIRFTNGGRLYATFISSRDAATTTDPFTFVFDGGVYQPTLAHTTTVHNASIRTIELRNSGMTFTASVNHTLAMRLTGSGDFVKKGTGLLTFAKDNECLSHKQAEEDVITLGDSGYKTADFTGTLDIQSGTVAIESGAARSGLKAEVAAGCTLDLCNGIAENYAVGGAGTIRNSAGGTLVVMAETNAIPTLSNIRADLLTVDFSRYAGTLVRKQSVAVAQLADGSTVTAFKSQNCGAKIRADFSVSDTGLVTAKMVSKQGLVVYVLSDSENGSNP